MLSLPSHERVLLLTNVKKLNRAIGSKCSSLCRTNYFYEFLPLLDRYERWKAIDLIERRNKREIVSPKFLPKMGENLKERYLEGGRGQLPITLMPCSPSKVSCNLAIRSIVDNVFVKKKKKKRQADEIEWKTDRLPTALHTDMHTLPTNDSSKKFLFPLPSSPLYKFSNRPKTCEQTFT